VGRLQIYSPLYDFDETSVSIQLVSPTSGETREELRAMTPEQAKVSIQLVSPTSGEKKELAIKCGYVNVSIQLVFLTSGESKSLFQSLCVMSFHSISFPNDWGEWECYSSSFIS
jgi:hypothetical protein